MTVGGPLDYIRYNYFLRLTMVHPKDAKEKDFSKGIIITETGATARYVLDTVEITHSVGWGSTLRSAFGLRGTLSIQEPGGVSLYDSILRSAHSLGIKNHLEATYLLTVQFIVENEPELSTGGLGWLYQYTWTIKVTNITSNIRPGGATYNLEWIEIGQQALNSSASRIQDTLTADKISTFGEFIDGFEEGLNDKCESEKNLSVLVPDSYEFIIPEEWKNWKFENKDDPDRQDPFARSTSDPTKLTLTVNRGAFIPDIIGEALGATTTFQKVLSDQSSSGEQSDRNKTDKQDLRTIKKFYRVQTDVEYGEYDVFRQDYSKKYIYKLISYYEPRIDSTQARTLVPNIGDKAQSAERLDKYKKADLLKKVYAYTFTGLNTNVLNFNLDLNNAYFAIQPIYGGTTLTDLPGYKFDESKFHKEEQLREDIKKLTADIKAIEGKSEQGPPGQASKTKESMVNSRNNKFNELSSSVSTGPQRRSAPTVPNKQRLPELSYAEQFQEDQNYLQEVNYYPVKYLAQPTENPHGIDGFPGSRHRGRMIFNTTLINLSQLKELANIDLEISGDPYWFGAENSIRDKDSPEARTLFADYELGSNMFFLVMNFPSTSLSSMDMSSNATTPTESSSPLPDMGTESKEEPATAENNTIVPDPWIKEANGLEAIYCVTQVISRFSGGLFTQHLYGYRDNSINVRLVEKQIKQGIVVPVLERTE